MNPQPLHLLGDAVNSAIGSNAHHIEHEFFGVIDDVYIYDRALSPSEVQALYSVVPEPSTALLVMIGLSALANRQARKNSNRDLEIASS